MRVIHKDKWHLFCEFLNLVYTLSAILSYFISFVFFSLSLSFLLNFFLRSYANQFVEILLMLIHVSLYKENIERISISIALSHCVILNMICRLMQMPMEITLLNPLNDPEHCSLSLPQGPKVNTHNHTHTRRAQISTQGNIEGKVYNELAIESRGSSGSSYSY